MRKLLSANLARLRKDRVFWCLLAVVVALSLAIVLQSIGSFKVANANGVMVKVEDYYFNLSIIIGIFSALFSSLFLGTEYSDGTIRNKLAAGHRRVHVFLAGYVVCLAASLTFLAGWLVTGCLDFLLIGPMEMSGQEFAAYILVAVGFTASFTALFTLVGSLSSNKAMTVIYALLVFVLLILLTSGIYDRLCELETSGGMAYVNGEYVNIPPTPNPLYLGGNVRGFWECTMDFLPTGQAVLMNETAIEHPFREVGFSVVLTAVALFAGCRAFRRKDIK